MKKIIEWLNGKKTVIGTTFLLIARFFIETGIGEGTEWVSVIVSGANWIGEILGTVGLVHKGIKAAKQ